MKRKSMRSPRRIDFNHKALDAIPLNDKAPPPADSISWKLWLACQDIAQMALNTDYMQGIKSGNLDPNSYGHYTIQDAVYCYHAQDDYQAMETRALSEGHSQIAAFAKARCDSYATYNTETFNDWHIADANAVKPGDAVQTYINFEHLIANDWHPIYGLICMIPCDQLWPWLATELEADSGSGNLYNFWITENADWGGAYRLDNFVDDWFAEYQQVYDWDSALFVYRSAMTCEVNSFRSACGQALVPMPQRKNPPMTAAPGSDS